jgi:hypothetical protein
MSCLARRAQYFYWNGYCLIFLITIIAFSSFAIPPKYVIFYALYYYSDTPCYIIVVLKIELI